MPSQVKKEDFEKWRNGFANAYGLLCFSKKYSNPVMWGQYAADASGVVLGFDISTSDQWEVNYCDGFLAPMKMSDDKKFVKDFLTTKAKAWRYEKEVRIMQRLSDARCKFDPVTGKFLYFEPFSKSMKLREILLGVDCKADQSTINAMKRYTTPSVDIRRTARSKTEFKIIKAEKL